MFETPPKAEPRRRVPRFERSPKLLPNRQITALDLGLIETLNDFHILPTSLILALTSAHPVTIYEHLQTLWHTGLISRFFFSRLGAGEAYYYLDNPKVVDLLASYDRDTRGFDRALIRRRRERPYSEINDPELGEEMEGRRLFLKHEVMIARFHAILELACRKSAGAVVLAEWWEGPRLWNSITAPKIRYRPEGGGWVETDETEKLPHRPDAFFTLRILSKPAGDQERHFFYEADRKNTDGPKFARKLRAHFELIVRQKHQNHLERLYGVSRIRAVITETPDSAWAMHLRNAAGSRIVSPKPSSLFWFIPSDLFMYGHSYVERKRHGVPAPKDAYFLTHPEIVFEPLWATPVDDRFRSLLD